MSGRIHGVGDHRSWLHLHRCVSRSASLQSVRNREGSRVNGDLRTTDLQLSIGTIP